MAQRTARNPQPAGGGRHVALAVVERLEDLLAFELGDLIGECVDRTGRGLFPNRGRTGAWDGFGQQLGETGSAEDALPAGHHQPLEHVHQLAHVAGPAPAPERLQELSGGDGWRAPDPAGDLAEAVRDERR